MKPKNFTNVWDAIAIDQTEAINLKSRSQLMMRISDYVKKIARRNEAHDHFSCYRLSKTATAPWF